MKTTQSSAVEYGSNEVGLQNKHRRNFFLKAVNFVLLLIVVISCLSLAQTPIISTKYSDAEIDKLIARFKTTTHEDVSPTVLLQQQFQHDFSEARYTEWESNNQIYKVEFEIDSRHFAAFYDNEGNLLMYKQEIRTNDLPIVVKNTATTHYPNYRFDSVYLIIKGTQIFYKIEVEQSENDVTLFVNNNGKIFERESEF
ncbi:MAG: hypothetical protein LBM68_00335 [Bacteroidales bacterium]|jgi:hypothetical protein|nr:hypothetical protein [Bacteroidales bacterium]